MPRLLENPFLNTAGSGVEAPPRRSGSGLYRISPPSVQLAQLAHLSAPGCGRVAPHPASAEAWNRRRRATDADLYSAPSGKAPPLFFCVHLVLFRTDPLKIGKKLRGQHNAPRARRPSYGERTCAAQHGKSPSRSICVARNFRLKLRIICGYRSSGKQRAFRGSLSASGLRCRIKPRFFASRLKTL